MVNEIPGGSKMTASPSRQAGWGRGALGFDLTDNQLHHSGKLDGVEVLWWSI
jgi:hypothetical protein